MIKVAIIGSKGFVGRHLVWYLKEMKGIIANQYDIADVVDNPNYKKLNLLDKDSISCIDLNVDYIFMMAGMTGTAIGFDKYEAFVDTNEIALLNLLDAIRKTNYRPRIVFPSSRLVYKGTEKALKESDEKETKTIYAVNKLACEGYLKAYNVNFDIPYTIFRICVPYGNVLDNNYSFGTIGFFIKMAEQGKDITLYGGGLIRRTFTHIEDICYQMVEGAFSDGSKNDTYNIDGEECSLHYAASMIAKHYGVNVAAVPWPVVDEKLESGSTFFDASKIQTLLGYKDLKHSLKDVVKEG